MVNWPGCTEKYFCKTFLKILVSVSTLNRVRGMLSLSMRFSGDSGRLRGPLPSLVCAPCDHRAAQDSRLALSLGRSHSFRPDLSHIFAAPKADRLDSEST